MARELAQGMNQPRVVAPRDDRTLNAYQRAMLRVYGQGDYKHLIRYKRPLEFVKNNELAVGDGLFTFILIELGDDGKGQQYKMSKAEAVRRMESAQRELQEVIDALEDKTT